VGVGARVPHLLHNLLLPAPLFPLEDPRLPRPPPPHLQAAPQAHPRAAVVVAPTPHPHAEPPVPRVSDVQPTLAVLHSQARSERERGSGPPNNVVLEGEDGLRWSHGGHAGRCRHDGENPQGHRESPPPPGRTHRASGRILPLSLGDFHWRSRPGTRAVPPQNSAPTRGTPGTGLHAGSGFERR